LRFNFEPGCNSRNCPWCYTVKYYVPQVIVVLDWLCPWVGPNKSSKELPRTTPLLLVMRCARSGASTVWATVLHCWIGNGSIVAHFGVVSGFLISYPFYNGARSSEGVCYSYCAQSRYRKVSSHYHEIAFC